MSLSKTNKIKIESYTQSYLNDIIKGWNETLIYDSISEDRFVDLIVLDDNFNPDLALVALYENEVVGFILAVKRKVAYLTRGLEESRAWISVMYVLAKFQHKGCGQQLLDEVTKRLKTKKVQEITLCAYSPNYFTPGVDYRYQNAICFFKKNNYIQGDDAVSMQRDLWDYQLPLDEKEKIEKLSKENIRFISYHDSYRERLLKFLACEFPGGWERNALLAMQKRIAHQTIILCVENESVIGFCMRKIDGKNSRFGPIGIMESKRNQHLGSTLMHVMMDDMKKRGIYYLYFLWTHGSTIRFYNRMGLTSYRTYQLLRKEV